MWVCDIGVASYISLVFLYNFNKLINAEEHLHLEFVSVHVALNYIDLGMGSFAL